MQVNSVSLANANSKPVFKGPREDLESFAYMDEESTRNLALARTSKDVKDKKHKAISRALYLAAPLSGGLAAACSVPSKVLTKVGGVNVSRATRIAAGAAGALRLGALFLGIDAIFALKNKIERAESKGISKENIIIDVGIGFGKTKAHNFELIRRIDEFKSLGCEVMLGISRKSLLDMANESNETKDIYTTALSSLAIERNVDYLRIHNVEMHKKLIELMKNF